MCPILAERAHTYIGELVPLDGLEEFLEFCTDGEVSVLGGLIGSLDCDFAGVLVRVIVLAGGLLLLLCMEIGVTELIVVVGVFGLRGDRGALNFYLLIGMIVVDLGGLVHECYNFNSKVIQKCDGGREVARSL